MEWDRWLSCLVKDACTVYVGMRQRDNWLGADKVGRKREREREPSRSTLISLAARVSKQGPGCPDTQTLSRYFKGGWGQIILLVFDDEHLIHTHNEYHPWNDPANCNKEQSFLLWIEIRVHGYKKIKFRYDMVIVVQVDESLLRTQIRMKARYKEKGLYNKEHTWIDNNDKRITWLWW